MAIDHDEPSAVSPSAWLPIESAPKDGTEVLVWAAGCGFSVMRWLSMGWDDGDFHSGHRWPTHWMPLPAPPVLTTGGSTPQTPPEAT
jgi:hypothetical protein